MLILRLNSEKVLSLRSTTSNYVNENNFDKIRIIADKSVGEHNLIDLSTELYVYDIAWDNSNTFNDCVPVEFTLDSKNNYYTFEAPIKEQYTLNPTTCFYLKMTDENGVVGKTNVVQTSITPHKDKTVSVENSIEVFEKYKKDLSKITVTDSSSEFIYFKKECDNWSTPRIYYFDSNQIGEGITKTEIWAWEDSPYMLEDEDGYFYYPLIRGADSVIFFCDETSSGWNYKTSDLKIPPESWYKTPLYVQSELGLNGFWADYNTKETKFLVQLNGHCPEPSWYKYININAEYTNSNDIVSIPEILDFGLVQNGNFGDSKNPYKIIKLPIDFKQLNLTFEEYSEGGEVLFSHTYNTDRYETCYNQTVIYVSDIRFSYDYAKIGSLGYFNAYVDENLVEYIEGFDLRQYTDNLVNDLKEEIINSNKNYIYFWKRCNNWSNPRVHFFTEFEGAATTWDNSPYMEQVKDNLYRYEIASGCDKVIFFCDQTSDGYNYQTSKSLIPLSSLYKVPVYFQSSIGYDGIWGDLLTNTFRLYIAKYSVQYYDNRLIDYYIKLPRNIEESGMSLDYYDQKTNSNKTLKFNRLLTLGEYAPVYTSIDLSYDSGINSPVISYSSTTNNLYYYADIPFSLDWMTLRINSLDSSIGYNIEQLCYNVPLIPIIDLDDAYIHNQVYNVRDGYNYDYKCTNYYAASETSHSKILDDIDIIKSSVSSAYSLAQTAYNRTDYSTGTVSRNLPQHKEDGDLYDTGSVYFEWMKNGQIVTMSGYVDLLALGDWQVSTLTNCLPYVCRSKSLEYYYPIYPKTTGNYNGSDIYALIRIASSKSSSNLQINNVYMSESCPDSSSSSLRAYFNLTYITY